MFDRDSFLKNLPNLPGVYRMLNAAGQIIYVGKAVNLRKRVVSYFRAQTALSPRAKLMVGEIASVEITVTRSESEALLLENNLIKTLTPRYNILFRDDKSYPYILFSKHKYPRIGFFRGTPNKSDKVFGPFPNAAAVRESIGFIQKVFRIRTCEDSVFSNRTRPCLLYQISRCTAPCVNKISEAGYSEHITNAKLMFHGKEKEIIEHLSRKMHESAANQHYEEAALYRDQIHNLTKVQETQFVSSHKSIDSDIVVAVSSKDAICVNLTMVRRGMHLGDRSFFPQNVHKGDLKSSLEAFVTQHYLMNPAPPQIVLSEAVTIDGLGEVLNKKCAYAVKIITKPNATQKIWLQMAIKNAQLALGQNLSQATNQQQMMHALRECLTLDETAQRIECFDVSHTMGEATVVSCVVYDNYVLQKGEYRRYNITGVTPGDDYGALENALTRRYEKVGKGEGKVPDLILIDGGVGQVGVAQKVLTEAGLDTIPLVGVAKGLARKAGEEKLIFPDERMPLQLPPDNIGLHLIQQIRDEAHRFAIVGHRAKRAKTRNTSFLEKIDGVGAKRRQKLLTKFGGLNGLRAASIDDLCRVDGISRALAEKIYQECH